MRVLWVIGLAAMAFVRIPLGAGEPAGSPTPIVVEDWKNGDNRTKFAVREYKDGVLRLVDADDGKANNTLVRTFAGKDLDGWRGKELVFSADINVVAASHPGFVGLTLKAKDGQNRETVRSVRAGGAGGGFAPFTVSLPIPADARSVTASLDCATGWYRTAEALFRGIALTPRAVAADGSDAPWNTGGGRAVRFGGDPSPWVFRAWGGASVAYDNNTLTVAAPAGAPPGGAALALGDGREPTKLSGDFNKAKLVLVVKRPEPFTVGWRCWGVGNGPVPVDPSTVAPDTSGNRRLEIPLTAFAAPHDLQQLDALVLQPGDGGQQFAAIDFVGLDDVGPPVNLLGNASFEAPDADTPAFMLFGDYRPEALASGAGVVPGRAVHGDKALRLEPGGFFTWSGMDWAKERAVFSVHAVTAVPDPDAAGEIELTLQPLPAEIHGLLGGIPHTRRAPVAGEWSRPFVASPKADIAKRTMDFTAYRAVVRNTGAVPVLLDGVQLEQGSPEPRAFVAERDSRARFRLGENIALERYVGLEIGRNARSGTVPLAAVNPSDKPRTAADVRGGVPFPRDELFTPDGVEVVDEDGRAVPAQFLVLGRRPVGGSVVSLLVNFQADLPARGSRAFRLRYGPAKTAAVVAEGGMAAATGDRPFLAAKQGDDIRIDTGALALTLTPKRPSLFAQGTARCVAVTADGIEHSGPAEVAEIVENGPESCLVFLRGTAGLAWELRIAAFKNKPYLRIDYAFERNFGPDDPLHRRFKAIYLELPGAGTEGRIEVARADTALSPVDARALRASGNPVDLKAVQRHAREGEAVWDALVGPDRPRAGMRLSGRGWSGTAAVRVEEMTEMAPRALSVGTSGIRAYHWPDEGVALLDVAAGLSAEMRLWYAPAGDVPDGPEPLLQPDIDWVARSGVFGDFLPDAESAARFPNTTANLRAIEDATRRHASATFLHGLGDYGDFGSRNYYRNHETATVQMLWWQYLRSYRPEDFALAAAHSRHERDLDQCHFRRGSTGVHPHYALGNVDYNFHTGHFWVTGLVWHYYLTGDHRSLESAIGSAAVLAQKARIQYGAGKKTGAGRERHRMLQHLAELYELTGNPQLRAAFELQYGHGGNSDGSSYYGGLSMECLDKLHDVTGDPRYRERQLAEIERFRQANVDNLPPMPAERGASPGRSGYANEGRSWLALYAGARIARQTGKPEYLDALERDDMPPLLPRMVSLLSRDQCAEWAGGYLAALAAFGRNEPEAMPAALHFTSRMTGAMRIQPETPFVYRLDAGDDGIAVLDVFRQRKFRYWGSKPTEDFVAVRILDNAGRPLETATLDGNVTFEHRRFSVKVPPGAGATAEVTFRKDCWGGVASPRPLAVRADRWFAARSSSGGSSATPVAVDLTGPRSGRIALDWRWDNRRNDRIGEPLAAQLETPEGEVIARAAYIVPLSQTPEPQATHRLELAIPEEHRGRPLRLWIADVKWMEWRIDSLDEPWLF